MRDDHGHISGAKAWEQLRRDTIDPAIRPLFDALEAERQRNIRQLQREGLIR